MEHSNEPEEEPQPEPEPEPEPQPPQPQPRQKARQAQQGQEPKPELESRSVRALVASRLPMGCAHAQVRALTAGTANKTKAGNAPTGSTGGETGAAAEIGGPVGTVDPGETEAHPGAIMWSELGSLTVAILPPKPEDGPARQTAQRLTWSFAIYH